MGGYSRKDEYSVCCRPCTILEVGIAHKGVNIFIRQGDECLEGVNKSVNIDPHMIDVDLENILENWLNIA